MGSGISTKYKIGISKQDLYDHLTEGCKIKTYKDKMVLYTVLDNHRINFRPYTSSQGSPAVDIFIEQPKNLMQKIHFIQREL